MKCPKCKHEFNSGEKSDKGNPQENQFTANAGLGSKAAKMIGKSK